MKILCISTLPDGLCSVQPGADSAILREGEPVFVPDPVEGWDSCVAPAIRISRLGTAIKARRAAGYYDAVTLFHLLRPADASVASGIPPFVIDRVFAPGRWMPVSGISGLDISLCRRHLKSDDILTEENASLAFADLSVDDTISLLSEYMTFKTGDILVFTGRAVPVGTPVLDTELSASLNGTKVLEIRFK